MIKTLLLVVFAATSVYGCAGVGRSNDSNNNVLMLVDDFERGIENWNKAAVDNIIGNFSLSNDAKNGNGALKIRCSERKEKGGWFTILSKIDKWPEGANQISFWAKGEKPVRAKSYITVGTGSEVRGFVCTFNLGTEWSKYTIPLSKFRFSWGNSKTLDVSQINGLGFELKDIPATFLIDDVQIEKGTSAP